MYQALLFPSPREARASPYAGKRGTGDEATMDTCPIHQPPIIAMCSTHNTHISPYWLDLLYTFNVCVPYEGDQHIYLIPIVWSIMAHEDNANINSMSTLHSSPFLTNPACKHHWSLQRQIETPQTVQHETHPPW